MKITIERIKPEDASMMLRFLRQVGGETDNLTFGAEGLPITPEAETDYISQLENSRDQVMLVAKCDGRIVGSASLSRLPRRMSHRGDFSISVAKEYWSKGIGSQLLAEIIRFAKDHAFERIDLQVRSDNLSAIHLYEKYGFQKLCTYPGFFKLGGQYVDFDYMTLTLSCSNR